MRIGPNWYGLNVGQKQQPAHPREYGKVRQLILVQHVKYKINCRPQCFQTHADLLLSPKILFAIKMFNAIPDAQIC